MRHPAIAAMMVFTLGAPACAEPLPPGMAAVVGDQVISDYDVDQRVGLICALFDKHEPRNQILEELKSETWRLEVAQRRKVLVPAAEVDRTVGSILRANRIAASRFEALLAHCGTTTAGLRHWIAVRLAWAKATKQPDDWNYAFPGLAGPRQPKQGNLP
jgi:hypothetical protein